jgi:hypothetical protein
MDGAIPVLFGRFPIVKLPPSESDQRSHSYLPSQSVRRLDLLLNLKFDRISFQPEVGVDLVFDCPRQQLTLMMRGSTLTGKGRVF